MRKIIQSVIFCSFFVILAHADLIVVTSLDDSGVGTLREAITNAEANDIINFDGNLSGTITLQSSLPDITVDYLTISGNVDGSGHNLIAIDGDSSYRIFNVEAQEFSVAFLNLSHGSDFNQGGIVKVGESMSATLLDAIITPGSDGTNPSYVQNHLYVSPGGSLRIVDCPITVNNSSDIYVDNGVIHITSDTPISPLIYNMSGVNEGNLRKWGNNSAVVSTPSGITSGFNFGVDAGTLEFYGETTGSCFTLARLQGEFNVLELNNHGSVQPGSDLAFGTITLTSAIIGGGGFNQVSGKILTIKIDDTGACDLITGDGAGSIDGALEIIPAPGTYMTGQKYRFLTQMGGYNGTFSSVTSGSVNVQINYNIDSIEIEIL